MRKFSPEELKARGVIPRMSEALSACAEEAGKG